MQEANAMATTIDPNAPVAPEAGGPDAEHLVSALAARLAGALLPGDKADFSGSG
jgi:glutamate dehydrogenase